MPASPPRKRCERPGCPNFLTGKQRRFCSNSCRAIFANMKKTADKRALAESMALEEIREQILPVTRELLTDNVLNELNNLVNLLPLAVAELKRELDVDEEGHPLVEDPDVRHKAAMQLLKWTVGNQSIAPASLEQQPAPMQVFIGSGIDQRTAMHEHDIEGSVEEPEELKECMECHLMKPARQFVGESQRCQDCHQKLLDRVAEEYGRDMVRSVDASREPSPAGLPLPQVRAGVGEEAPLRQQGQAS